MGLIVSNVSLELGDGDQKIKALDDVSLRVKSGELMAILGPSGAGKSSLLAVCGGLRTPTTGAISINEREITAMKPAALTKLRLDSIGFVFQQSNLVAALSSLDQLLLMEHLRGSSTGKKAKDRAMALLAEVDMAHKADRRPDELSGGERQRIGIARALMTRPALLLVDEPTSMLDQVRGKQIVELLKKECHEHEVATLMVTHDQSMLEIADSSVSIVDGKLQA